MIKIVFIKVAAIIDVDVVPEVCRRVRLLKHGSDKPLGFYIRDGTSVRVTPSGLERVPGIYISRLVPGKNFLCKNLIKSCNLIVSKLET